MRNDSGVRTADLQMGREVEFASQGITLRGRLFVPEGEGPHPVVVLAHGFSGTMDIDLPRYAKAFGEAGLAALAYDHPNFGASDGTTRQEADPIAQVQGYVDAVTFVSGLAGIDPTRIGVWGTSYSGGHVIVAAARDRRIGCVVAQVPYIGAGVLEVPAPLATLVEQDRKAREGGDPPAMVPVVAPSPGAFSALPGADAAAWFLARGEQAPTWRNEVTLRSLEMLLKYRPLDSAGLVEVPLLVLAASEDVLTTPAAAEEAFSCARGPKRMLLVPGGHFDIYDSGFPAAAGAATAWFREYLVDVR